MQSGMVTAPAKRRGLSKAALAVGVCRVVLCLMFLVAPIGLRTASACDCGPNPPCSAVWKADAVFIGTAVDKTSEWVGGSLSWTVHKIAVTQTLRGSVDPFITLVPGETPTADQIAASLSHANGVSLELGCQYRFQSGRQYLIYARRTADGRWTTS